MKRLILAGLALLAAFVTVPATTRPAAAAPVPVATLATPAAPLVEQVHSRRWYYARRHYRPYGYRYRRAYAPGFYYRGGYRRHGFHRRHGFYRRHYGYRRHFYGRRRFRYGY